jgi:hypothetical protein
LGGESFHDSVLDNRCDTAILDRMNTPTSDERIRRLEELLVGLLDGIDGYESETGTLGPYWKLETIEAARAYLEALPDRGAAAGYWLATGR